MTAIRCVNALNRAAGRELTYDELQTVFAKINATARDLAAGRQPPGFKDKALRSTADVVRMAAEIQAKEAQAEAARKVRNANIQVTTIARRMAESQQMEGAGVKPLDAVRRLVANDADGRTNQFSLEARALGVRANLLRQMTTTWDAMGGKFFGLFEDAASVRALLMEIRGKDSGNAAAKEGAAAWLKMTEGARQWFNEKGGNIGHLDDWGTPQHHSQEKVAASGRDQWIADVAPLLDRSKYVEIDGQPMTDAQVRDFLGKAWESIATDGANKIEPGKFSGTGARANRNAKERQVHFKDADSTIAYWSKYGERTLPDIMMGHVRTLANDIAFLEHFGPNPDATYRMLRDDAYKRQVEANPTKLDKANAERSKLDRLYDYASGNHAPTASRVVAGVFKALAHLNVAGKLGSAVFASLFGDKVMFEAMGHVNNLPAFQRWRNELRLMNPANAADRRILRRQGLMLDYMAGAMNRFGEELGASAFTGKLASTVMRASGMSAVNEFRRGAWALTAMDTIGHLVQRKDWASIGADDTRMLHSYGITEHDWNVWKLAQPEKVGYGNAAVLTPDAIGRISDDALKAAHLIGQADGPEVAAAARRDAQVKLLGAITSESHLGVIEPGWSDRAKMYGGLQRGNLRDELTRSFWQFKAFPFAQFERMLDIGLSRPTLGGKAAFLTMVPVMGTMAGAMMLQVQDVLAGKDPRPMDDWKFWAAAAIKGGSLGIYGDFLYSQSGTTRYGSGPLEIIAGPTIGAAASVAAFAVQAGNSIGTDKETHFGARALNIAKGFIPAQNLWYTKAATDHMIFQNLQEVLNPGYLSNMRERTAREFGQEFWWEPGEIAPHRAPNFGKALEAPP